MSVSSVSSSRCLSGAGRGPTGPHGPRLLFPRRATLAQHSLRREEEPRVLAQRDAQLGTLTVGSETG